MSIEPRKPNFLFIGPDRSGSTWVDEVLRAHPQVFTPYSKELFYFDYYYHLGEEWYLEHFTKARPEHRVVAEVSHDYLFSPEAAQRIHAMLPDVRLMTCLREPVDRALSAYLLMRKQARVRGSFEEEVDRVDELVDHGLYAKHLAPYYERFPRERIYTPLFDDLQADPNRFAQDLFAFLGIDPFPLPTALIEPVNQAAEPRNFTVARLARQTGVLVRKVGAPDLVTFVKSSPLVQRALYRPLAEHERPEISPQVRDRLRERFRDDVHELANMTGIDVISRWGY